MISFQLTEEQNVVRDAVRKFVQQEIRPRMRDCEASGGVPTEMRLLAREIGLLLLDYPEPIGGGGLDFISRAIVAEELAFGDPGIALYLDQPGPAGYAILECGRLDQQIAHLHPFSDPKNLIRAAFALEEEDFGSWEGRIATRASKGRGNLVIRGRKRHVLGPSEASFFVVAARVSEDDGWAGVRFFVVPREASGVTVHDSSYRLGLRCCEIADVTFDGVTVPEDAILDGPNDPVLSTRRVLSRMRVVNAARMVGVARAASDHALQYAQDRVAFESPIGAKQGIAFKLADDRTMSHAARWLVWEGARDVGKGGDATVSSCMAVLQASEAALSATVNAVQTLGGLGFMEDAPVEKWMRDARCLANLNGVPFVQSRIAAQALGI